VADKVPRLRSAPFSFSLSFSLSFSSDGRAAEFVALAHLYALTDVLRTLHHYISHIDQPYPDGMERLVFTTLDSDVVLPKWSPMAIGERAGRRSLSVSLDYSLLFQISSTARTNSASHQRKRTKLASHVTSTSTVQSTVQSTVDCNMPIADPWAVLLEARSGHTCLRSCFEVEHNQRTSDSKATRDPQSAALKVRAAHVHPSRHLRSNSTTDSDS
jgi:hypothetical protein